MKDANLKAIEELNGLINNINCYKYKELAADDWYRVGFNQALDIVLGTIARKLDRLEKEVIL